MLTRWSRAAAVTLALLAVITPAHAACAWVLWEEVLIVSKGTGIEWTIVGTGVTVDDCRSFADRAVTDRGARWQRLGDAKVEVQGNQVTVRSASSHLNYRYLCLPDTVDPRAPRPR